MIKILHTGDVHLDSPFSRLDPRRAEMRKNELRATFASMMDFAKKNAIDIILIAGDLFDGEFATRETVALIASAAKNSPAKIFIAPGNHDPATPNSVYAKEGIFPDNVHIFKTEELERVSLDDLGVDVYGYAFTSESMTENPAAGRHVEDEGRINILVGHADTRSADSKYCPVNEELIRAFGADYTALAHIHNAPEPRKVGGAAWAFCGCLEGRDFTETGPKGALLVKIEKKDGVAEEEIVRLRFSKRRYESESLSVDGAATRGEIVDRINAFIGEKGYGGETLLSLTLRGGISSSLILNPDDIEKEITGLFCFELSDETYPEEAEEELMSDITVKGQFYRELLPALNGGDEARAALARRALRYGLAALSGENIVDFN